MDYYEDSPDFDVGDFLEDSGRRQEQRLEKVLTKIEEQLDQRYQLFQESLEELMSSLDRAVDELDEEYQSFFSGHSEERIRNLKGEIEEFYRLIREKRQSHWSDRQRLEKERREILRELEELEEFDSVSDLL